MAKRLTAAKRREASEKAHAYHKGVAMSFRHDPYKWSAGEGMEYWYAWDAHFQCHWSAPEDASWEQKAWSSYLYARYERLASDKWIRGEDPTGVIRLNTVVQTSYGTGPYQVTSSHKHTICRCENCYPVPAYAHNCRHKDDHIPEDLFDVWSFSGIDADGKRRGPFSMSGYVLHKGEVVSYHGRNKLIVVGQVEEYVQDKLF
jgi:hypothetical protein